MKRKSVSWVTHLDCQLFPSLANRDLAVSVLVHDTDTRNQNDGGFTSLSVVFFGAYFQGAGVRFPPISPLSRISGASSSYDNNTALKHTRWNLKVSRGPATQSRVRGVGSKHYRKSPRVWGRSTQKHPRQQHPPCWQTTVPEVAEMRCSSSIVSSDAGKTPAIFPRVHFCTTRSA